MPDDFKSRIRSRVSGQKPKEEPFLQQENLKKTLILTPKMVEDVVRDDMQSRIRAFGIDPTAIWEGVTSGIEGAIDKYSRSTDALSEGDIKGGLTGYVAGTLSGTFGLLQPLAPLAAFTSAIKDIEKSKILPDEVMKYGLQPVTSIVKPENLFEESLSEIGDIVVQGLVAHKLGKTAKGRSLETKAPIKEVPQDVKQTLQIEAPKGGTFEQINVDPTGRNRTIPKTENTQAYTKLELLRDEVSAKKDKLVSDREILKKQAFDKNATKEQRIEAKNKLKLVTEELNDVSKRLPLINKELEAKRFEVESKPIPEQKQLTEGIKEPIPTENTNVNPYTGQGSKIDFTVATEPGAKTKTKMDTEKLPGVKRAPHDYMKDREIIFGLEKTKDPIDPLILSKVLNDAKGKGVYGEALSELRKEAFRRGRINEFEKALKNSEKIEIVEPPKGRAKETTEQTNLLTKKQDQLTEPFGQPKSDIKISEIKSEPIENKTVENIKKAQDIVGKDKFNEIANKLGEGKEPLLQGVYTEELANKIVKEGKLPNEYTKLDKPIENVEKPEANLEPIAKITTDELKVGDYFATRGDSRVSPTDGTVTKVNPKTIEVETTYMGKPMTLKLKKSDLTGELRVKRGEELYSSEYKEKPEVTTDKALLQISKELGTDKVFPNDLEMQKKHVAMAIGTGNDAIAKRFNELTKPEVKSETKDDIRSTKTYDMYRKLGKTDAEAVELIKTARQEGKNMEVVSPDKKTSIKTEPTTNPTIERLKQEALGDKKPEITKSDKTENEKRLERLNNQLYDAERGAPEKFLENRSAINRLKREIRDEEIRQGIRPPLDKPEIIETKLKDFTEQKKFIQTQFDRLLSEIESLKPIDRLGRDIEFKMGDFTARIMNPNVETLREFRKSASQSTNTSGFKNQGLNPKAKIDIDAVNQAKINIIKKSLGQNNFGFDVSMLKDYGTIGRYYFEKGATKFADWSAQMVKDLGEKIKPQLLRIWNEVKKFGEDLGKIAVDKIGDFIESKYNPAKPLKIVDQNLFEKPKSKIEPKSAFSEGMKDIAQKDRQAIKNEYREAIKEKEKFSTKAKNLVKEVQDVKKIAKTVFEPISTGLEKVSKDVFRRFRMYGQSYQVNLLKRHESVGDYFDVKSKSKMSADVKADYDISLMNGWFDDARKIAKEYGFEKQLDNVLKIKDDLAKELGVKTIENHFPRMVEDFDGFVKFLEEKYPDYYKDNFSRMIVEKANRIGRELTTEEKANLINNSLRGYNPGITLSDTGNMRKRIIQTLDGELAKFYHTPDASLLKYINEMTELSESRKFFGKGGYDVNESIGAYIQELREGKKIDLEGSRELMEIFKSRFNQRTITNKGITALRDIGVITKLGNPYSTMTQLKDLAYSMYFDPLRTPVEFAKVIKNKMGGKTPEWQIKELGIDPLKIAEELANPKKRAKIVQAFLDYSGFSKLDMIGKETLINTLWNKYQKQSKDLKLNTEFERRIERYFGKGEEKAKVLSDLRNGKKTDSTAFLLYNELVGAQPISLTEMPRGYLKGGNWRIAYFLKTFSIRQLDFALNETVRVMRDKTLPKEQRRQGAYNLMKLTTSLALTGATVDQIRSYLMNALTGKKNDQSFSDDMLDNLLNVSLLSRYDYTKVRRSGISEALGSKVLPPMDFLGDPMMDLVDLPEILSEKGKALRSTKQIPMFGKFLYEYLKDSRKQSSRNTSRNTRR